MPRLTVAVVARAASERIGPYRDGVLRIHVTRPPANGEANRAVLRAVASALGVAVSAVRLAGGERSRRKVLEVSGLSAEMLEERLGRIGH